MQSLLPKARSWPLVLQQTIVCDRETQTASDNVLPASVSSPSTVPVTRPKKRYYQSSKLLQRHYYPEGGWGWVIIFCATFICLLNHGLQLAFNVTNITIAVRHRVTLIETGSHFLCSCIENILLLKFYDTFSYHQLMERINAHAPEILPQIFILLPIEDRRNVRLTCHLWYYECSHPKIINKEKFVFRQLRKEAEATNDYDGNVERIMQLQSVIEKVKTWRTHCEFHGIPVRHFPSSVWKIYGNRTEVLFIYDCDIDEETFANVVVHFTNLVRFRYGANPKQCKKLSFVKNLFCDTLETTDTPRIDELIRSGTIRREKLISFEFYINDLNRPWTVSSKMYKKIFKIYPRIRTFGHGRMFQPDYLLQRYTLTDDSSNSSAEWAFPPHNLMDRTWSAPTTLKFEEYVTTFADLNNYRTTLLDFFSKQTKLENVRLNIRLAPEEPYPDRPSILFHILKNLPMLKVLQYITNSRRGDVYLTVEKFREFLEGTCKLESLLFPSLISNWPPSSLIDVHRLLPSVRYTRLKRLYLGSLVSLEIVSEILSRCSTSLEFLRLELRVDYMTAQKIFEIHTKLRTLYIESLEMSNVSDNLPGIIGLPSNDEGNPSEQKTKEYFSFRRLQSLRRLEIKWISSSDINIMISELNSPNLRYFQFPSTLCLFSNFPLDHLKLHQMIIKTMHTLTNEAPLLEILAFYSEIPLRPTELSFYCKQLRRLQTIFVISGPRSKFLRQWVSKNEADVEELFVECQSLRWLVDELVMYSYDRFSKELITYTGSMCFFDDKYNIWSSF